MPNLESILKSRDITLLTKLWHTVKAMVFSVVFYRCESWSMEKAEHQRIDAFKLWCWKTLESPLDYKIKLVNPNGNQPWIFIGRSDAEAEAPTFWPPDSKSRLIGKDTDAGKDWSKRRRGQQRVRWLDSITNSMNINLSELWEIVEDRGVWHAVVHWIAKSWTQLKNWTITITNYQKEKLRKQSHL